MGLESMCNFEPLFNAYPDEHVVLAVTFGLDGGAAVYMLVEDGSNRSNFVQCPIPVGIRLTEDFDMLCGRGRVNPNLEYNVDEVVEVTADDLAALRDQVIAAKYPDTPTATRTVSWRPHQEPV